MRSFEFGHPVEIGGKVYRITSDKEGAKKLIDRQIEQIRKISEAGGTESTITKKIETSGEKIIDALLGKGSFKEIFEGRRFNILDFKDLILFISAEIEEWAKDGTDNIN